MFILISFCLMLKNDNFLNWGTIIDVCPNKLRLFSAVKSNSSSVGIKPEHLLKGLCRKPGRLFSSDFHS